MTTSAQIIIPTLSRVRMIVPIIGTTPLITHKWSEKAKRQMLDKQQGKKKAKEVRDPQADYEASIYRTTDGKPGFPVLAFKAATVRGAKLAGLKMTEVRQMITVHGDPSDDGTQELAPLIGEPVMREDMVRVGMTTDLRYRAQFTEWATALVVDFYPTVIAQESVLSLVAFGGQTVGVGEWRPEKGGQNGTYEIDSDREVQVMGL